VELKRIKLGGPQRIPLASRRERLSSDSLQSSQVRALACAGYLPTPHSHGASCSRAAHCHCAVAMFAHP